MNIGCFQGNLGVFFTLICDSANEFIRTVKVVKKQLTYPNNAYRKSLGWVSPIESY